MGKSAVVQRALKLLTCGEFAELNEEEFAGLFGITARHLRRLFTEEVGQTAKQIYDNSRLGFARKLIAETHLPITEIAYSSGFSSIRRFNDAIRKRYHRPPTLLRKKRLESGRDGSEVKLSLSYRPPLDWESLLHFFDSHRIEGVEKVFNSTYERVFEFEGSVGALRITPSEVDGELTLIMVLEDYKHLFRVVQTVRQMFDLDSDPLIVANAFASCKAMSKIHGKYPGLRLPGGWSPFETAITTILGQLVSIDQARKLVRQLIFHHGKKVKHPFTGEMVHLFPDAKTLATAELNGVGTTEARKASIRELSRLVATQKLRLDATQDPNLVRESLHKIKGIGQWTAEYISLRALRDTDAFPATDLILRKAMEIKPKIGLDSFKPWRGYAAIYLWKEYARSLSRKKGATA